MTREYAPTRPVRLTSRGETVRAWFAAAAIVAAMVLPWAVLQ